MQSDMSSCDRVTLRDEADSVVVRLYVGYFPGLVALTSVISAAPRILGRLIVNAEQDTAEQR